MEYRAFFDTYTYEPTYPDIDKTSQRQINYILQYIKKMM